VGEKESDGTMISRAFAVLDAFRNEPVLGVSRIARVTALPRSTVHRITQQLVEAEALTRVGREYRLGVKLFELGTAHYPAKLRDALHPFLVDLQRVTGADVTTAELVGTDVVIVESVPARTSPASVVTIGARLPAHATAAGKIILAFSGDFPYKRDADLVAVTPRTVNRVAALRREIADALVAGVAFDRGEVEPDRSSVAAPLLNRHKRVLGALMVTGSDDGFDPARLATAVQIVAHTLTRVGQTANIEFYARLRPHGQKDGPS
jgi:IclR family transcriptional regulator, acetate operon repressor